MPEPKGWTFYSLAPFVENLPRIVRLIGSTDYETLEQDGKVFVRRLEG